MKKLVILLSILLCAFASYGQIKPYKISNYHLILVWGTDTAGWHIYPGDSLVYWSHLPLRMNFPSISIDEFKTGAGDTNILYVNGATGQVKSLFPSQIVGAVGNSFWKITGNSGTDTATNFVGTTDNVPLCFRVNNTNAGKIDQFLFNTFWGYRSGNMSGTGNYNTGIGETALNKFKTGDNNTAVGYAALTSTTTGIDNTGIGQASMYDNIGGDYNTAVGQNSMRSNTNGDKNTALGQSSLYLNMTGNYNTAVGVNSSTLSVGDNNISLGYCSGKYNKMSNRLHIGSIDYGDSAKENHCTPIYAIIGADSSSNEVYVNALTHIGAFNNGYWLPFNDGSANEVLTTDGSGAVSWQPAGGTSYWSLNTNNVYVTDTTRSATVGSDRTYNTETFGVNGSFDVYGSSGTPYTSFNGPLMYFNVAKGAFRAGYNTYGYYFDNAQVGTYSAGFNDLSLAQGTSSFAANNGTTAAGSTGYQAAAFNKGNANQNYSFASGVDTRADGYSSFIGGGYETDADSYLSAAFGRYNISGGTAGSWVSTDALFQIGNGTGTFGTGKFNDAFRLNKNGSGWFSSDSATTKIIQWNTLDSSVSINAVLHLIPLALPPSTPALGDIYVSTDTHIYFYSGAAWIRMDN